MFFKTLARHRESSRPPVTSTKTRRWDSCASFTSMLCHEDWGNKSDKDLFVDSRDLVYRRYSSHILTSVPTAISGNTWCLNYSEWNNSSSRPPFPCCAAYYLQVLVAPFICNSSFAFLFRESVFPLVLTTMDALLQDDMPPSVPPLSPALGFLPASHCYNPSLNLANHYCTRKVFS